MNDNYEIFQTGGHWLHVKKKSYVIIKKTS